MVQEGFREPLGHMLLREARVQYPAHLRSALVIGMSALEVGTKQFIGTIVPDSLWLVENMPSPSIVNILREYLPTLPVRLKLNDEVKAPPDSVLKTLKTGESLRNKTIHVGKQLLTMEQVSNTLAAVEQVLWLLDYYSGHSWAVQHFNSEIRGELGLT